MTQSIGRSELNPLSERAVSLLNIEMASAPIQPSPHGTPVSPKPSQLMPSPALRIGLLNNMPDLALIQTELQFRTLVGGDIDLRLFAFPETPRGPVAQAHLDAHYASSEALATAGLDALIITGSEPRLPNLEDEPYFAALGAVVDWAAANTLSTLFSCLAAHAAVLHLDGIRRKPLSAKLSGVYACTATRPHPLLGGMPETFGMPHSRWNGLCEVELAANGYVILQRSDEVGVDMFLREGQSLFVFLQGHPEYGADSLAREYRRDMLRFLEGTSAISPSLPANYFSDEAVAHLEHFVTRSRASTGAVLPVRFPGPERLTLRPAAWQPAAALLFRNWLSCVAMRRTAGVRQTAAAW